MRRAASFGACLILLSSASFAQQPAERPLSPGEMRAAFEAMVTQRNAAQNLHIACEVDGSKIKELIGRLEAEIKRLKEKPATEPKPESLKPEERPK